MRHHFKTCFILLFFISSKCFCQQNFYKNEIGFNSENDSYLGNRKDRYYTNGLFLSYRKAIQQKGIADSLSFTKKIWSINTGQYMYNAYSGKINNIDFVDRPFAAYLFAGASLQLLKSNQNSKKLSFEIGTIGKAALGKEAQELIHKTFGFYKIDGWQFQVKDEIGVNLKLNLNYLLHTSANQFSDFSLPLEARLGNTFSGAKAGILFRLGNINPLYHSIATQSNVSSFKEANLKLYELYFFLKPNINFIAYDATLQGGLFVNDKGPVTYSPNLFVFSQEIGVAYAKNRWTADFTVIYQSKAEKHMIHTNNYGSFNLFYRFN